MVDDGEFADDDIEEFELGFTTDEHWRRLASTWTAGVAHWVHGRNINDLSGYKRFLYTRLNSLYMTKIPRFKG